MIMTEVNESNFEEVVLKSDEPVLVDMYAPWCGPCRSIAPILEELSKEYTETVKIVKCNVDENPNIAVKYKVRSIPTVLYFKNGQVENLSIGALPKQSYKHNINLLLS